MSEDKKSAVDSISDGLLVHSYNISKILSMNPLKQTLYLQGKYKSKKIIKHTPYKQEKNVEGKKK